MTPDQVYKIAYRVWVRDMLPIVLRRPRIVALLMAAIKPIDDLYNMFLRDRRGDLSSLKYNGQVCYLRAALEAYCPSSRGIRYIISDMPEESGSLLYAYAEDSWSVDVASAESDVAVPIVYSWVDVSMVTGFLVGVPLDIYNTRLAEVRRVVDKYKLPTKTTYYYAVNS